VRGRAGPPGRVASLQDRERPEDQRLVRLRNWIHQADAEDGKNPGEVTGGGKKELAELRRRNKAA
jgi:hypothetical protein